MGRVTINGLRIALALGAAGILIGCGAETTEGETGTFRGGKADFTSDDLGGLDPTRAPTDEEWFALDADARQSNIEWAEYLDPGEWPGMRGIAFHEYESVGRPANLDRIYYAPYREFAKGMAEFMARENGLDVRDFDDSHSVVGDVQLRWVNLLVRTEDHRVLGGTIGYYQEGCDMPDFDESRSFQSEEEAEAAGCEFSDVNWQAHGVFDADGSALRYDEYMEWSGY